MAGCLKKFLDCALPPATSLPRRSAPSVAPAATRRVARGSCSNEAGAWISANKSDAPFGGNRFGTNRAQALGLVRKLYEAGATCVQVGEIRAEPERIKEEGGPYSATLFVTGPAAKLGAIQAVARGYGPDELDVKRGKLRMWWD